MKPEVGGESTRSEMAQEEFDPLDLMSGVAMLVLEARTPDNSIKGRVEGPHCPSFRQDGRHLCSKETLECLRALEFRERINVMWKNGIPSCIDILLFPACSHGQDEAQSLEGMASNTKENFILLERWSIQCIQKWHGEWNSGVSGSMLLQAVRSYLYFSQLSSWLTSMHGCLPITIAYRLYTPGEEAGVNFVQPPDSHAFPTGIYGPHGLKVHVLALPRQEHVPALLCALAGEQGDAGIGKFGGVHSLPVPAASGERSSQGQGPECTGTKPKRPPRKKASGASTDKSPSKPKDRPKTKKQSHSTSCAAAMEMTQISSKMMCTQPSVTKQQPGSIHPHSCRQPPGVMVPDQVAPSADDVKVKGQRSSARDWLEGQLRPLELPTTTPHMLDLHSPKVLMSAEAQTPGNLITKNKCIDFHSSDNRGIDDLYPTFEAKEDQLFLARHFRDLHSPLSPLDIQNFLANLQSLSAPIPPHIRLPASVADQHMAKKTCQELQAAEVDGYSLEEMGGMPKATANLPMKKLPPGLSTAVPDVRPKTRKLPYEARLLMESGDLDMYHSLANYSSQGQKGANVNLLLDKSSLEFGQEYYSSQKDKLIMAAQQWAESLEEQESHAEQKSSASSKAVKTKSLLDHHDFTSQEAADQLPGPRLSQSIDQTLRDINKIICAHKTKSITHEFQEVHPETDVSPTETAVSTSWSSTSSSSTYSSSSSVTQSLLGERERNSGASTPTNHCTPPSPVHLVGIMTNKGKTETSSSVAEEKVVMTDAVTPLQAEADLLVTNGVTSPSGEKSTPGEISLSLKSERNSFETPDATNGVFPEGPAKRRLQLDFSSRMTLSVLSQENHGQSSLQRVKHCSSTDKQAHVTEPWERESFNSENIPEQSYHKQEQKNQAPSLTSQNVQAEQGAATSEKLSLSLALQNCDLTNAISNSSVCKFYLQSPMSSSASLVSLDKGASKSQSLSALESSDVSEDLLIQTWQQFSMETIDIDQDSRSDFSNVAVDQRKEASEDLFSHGAVCLDVHSAHSRTHPALSNGCVAEATIPPSTCETQNSTHTAYHNGVAENDNISDEDRDVDEGQHRDVHSKVHHGPTRVKSAPNFSILSKKGKVAAETEGKSNEGVTRGRLATRDKSLLDLGARGASTQERLRHRLVKSASMMFSSRSSLPSQSSPAPVKRRSSGRFDYDETLTNTKAIKNALSMSRLPDVSQYSTDSKAESGRVLSTSAPASTNSLLGNFEESILNGRLEPAGVVDGFTVDIGASGSFCPRHLLLPVTAYFFHLSDDNAPSPYLGHISLDEIAKKGYHIPRKGTLQVTLFNPNKTVVKMFVVMYDLTDMPPDSQTVIRQRTVYMPVDPDSDEPSYLRYLIHLRVASSSSGKIYLHTDIRLIFARNKFELDSSVAKYELHSFTETPVNPKYSPKR